MSSSWIRSGVPDDGNSDSTIREYPIDPEVIPNGVLRIGGEGESVRAGGTCYTSCSDVRAVLTGD